MAGAARPAAGWRVTSGATGGMRGRASVGGPVAVLLPGNALIEPKIRCGLRQRVPVRRGARRSSQAGGPRAGAMRGGSAGSPTCVRMRCTGSVAVTKAIRRSSAPHSGQRSGKVANSRASFDRPVVTRGARARSGLRGRGSGR
jgi:hypothetical protein